MALAPDIGAADRSDKVLTEPEAFCRRKFGSSSRDLARPMFIHRTNPKPEGFGANSPGPSGFRLAATHFVRRLRAMDKHRRLAAFLVD
jgi:hypothetical protein